MKHKGKKERKKERNACNGSSENESFKKVSSDVLDRIEIAAWV
jgi:hypothetical protein